MKTKNQEVIDHLKEVEDEREEWLDKKHGTEEEFEGYIEFYIDEFFPDHIKKGLN